jgi:hypothetical protein
MTLSPIIADALFAPRALYTVRCDICLINNAGA